jgi:hypothetical protein
MRHVLTATTEADSLAVIVRAATTDLEEPPDWQRRANYAIGEDRRAVLTDAVRPRVKDWALQPTLRELLEEPETLGEGDVVVRRDWATTAIWRSRSSRPLGRCPPATWR